MGFQPADNGPDLRHTQSGHLQRSGRGRQWPTLRHSDPRTTAKCDQVHHSSLLPWYPIVRHSEARRGFPVDKTLGPKPSAYSVPLVLFRLDNRRTNWLRHHTVCEVYTDLLSVGLLRKGRMLLDLDIGQIWYFRWMRV